MHRLPSLIALQCFEASARHLSFTRAANELALTQSAVSRQVKKLEEMLGRSLFERSKQRISLTGTGAAYAEDIRKVLQQAETATLRITLGRGMPVRMGAEPAVAGRWLIPKLKEFQQSFPEIEIELVTDIHLLYGDSDARGYDLAILHGEGRWPGVESRELIPSQMVAVAAAELLGGSEPCDEFGGIVKWPLLHHTGVMSSSEAWLHQAGYDDSEIERLPGQRLENFQLILQAALQGLGVAILPPFFVAEELSQRRLVKVCSLVLNTGQSYYVAVPQEMRNQPALRCIADWLLKNGAR